MPSKTARLSVTTTPFDPINRQVLSPDTEMIIKRDHIATRHTNLFRSRDPRAHGVHGTLSSPHRLSVVRDAEAFASIRNVSRMLTCPHVLSLSFRHNVTGNFEHENNKKINDLTKTLKSPMAMFSPTAGEELEERTALQKGLADKATSVCSMVLNLTLFTHKAQQRHDVQSAKEAFSATGLDIKEQIMMQSQSVLSALPFLMSEGVWEDCGRAGRVER
ncbi:hypothetical protein BCU00_019720 [Vibrio breoganii]|uniref:TraC family protein n=1 Tax=Vibrio breoganii TaxID=553239 RepID=UPI0039A69753